MGENGENKEGRFRQVRSVYLVVGFAPYVWILTGPRSLRSIGVSNFEIKDLEILLASAKIKPAANQVSVSYPDDMPLPIPFKPQARSHRVPSLISS